MKLKLILLILSLLMLVGCGGSPSEALGSDNEGLDEPAQSEEQRYPDVLDVVLTAQNDGTFNM